MPTVSTASEIKWLRAESTARPVKVDREAKMIRGYVVAQAGEFKSGRGEFDGKSLRSILRMMNSKPSGLKSRLGHPTLSNDGVGYFLGRGRRGWLDKMETNAGEIELVRADLEFSESAFNTPNGDLATYVMDVTEKDPDAISSSLVLQTDEEWRLDKKTGRPMLDETGRQLPPLWRPTVLHASDIVDTGDAVDGLLSAKLSIDGLPDEIVRKGAELLRAQFAGQSRAFVESHLSAWCERVLSAYWPADIEDDAVIDLAERLEADKMEVEIFSRLLC